MHNYWNILDDAGTEVISQFSVFLGRATAALGGPVVFAAAHVYGKDLVLSERFAILPKRQPTLVTVQTFYDGPVQREPRTMLFAAKPVEMFALEYILKHEIRNTTAWLEALVLQNLSEQEQASRRAFFPYVLTEVDPRELIGFYGVGMFQTELTEIRSRTRCDALGGFLVDLQKIIPLRVREER